MSKEVKSKRPRSVWGQIGKCMLAFIVLLTGLPLLPNANLPRAYADTSLQINPYSLSSVYNGRTEVNFSFDDPDPDDETQESHETVISLERNGSTVATLKNGTYPTETNNSYTWNGKANGEPAEEGSYQIRVTPTRFPNNGNSGSVQIINPKPPQPIMDIESDTKSEEHTIRGIAEIGTTIDLKMKRIRRVGNDTTVDNGSVETLAENIKVNLRKSSWALAVPVNASYFTNFPERSDNLPEDYVGEWEVKVRLPAYEIAEIQAVATRVFDGKKSDSSKTLRVLRYKTPAWNINWSVIASYYYNVTEKEAIVEKIGKVAVDNGFPVEDCNGQTCYGTLEEGVNLLVMEPQQAGEIGQEDDERIHEEYTNRNGHPIAEAFDPVNLATGDFVFRHPNMSVQAVIPLDLTLTYHSRDRYDGYFGVGWHHTYERRLEFRENGIVYAVSPEGASHRFEAAGNGQYAGQDGIYDTLTKNQDGTYTQQTPQRWSYIYRRDGLLYQILDPNGNRIQLTYLGSLLTDVATNGAKLTLTYGAGGKVARVTDHSGRYAAYEYDAVNHDLTAMILPDGARIAYEYDDKHRIIEILNPNETASLINEYDEQDRVVRQRDFAGVWGSIEYDPAEMRTVTTDALGRQTVYQYDERYRKTAVTYADGTVERYLYDKHDNLIEMTDRGGRVWGYMYDDSGNLIRAKDPEGYQTEIRYNAFNLPEEIVDPLGHKTALGYDGNGNLTAITDAEGGVSRIAVDGRGIPVSVTNANGETASIENDEYGFARFITDPLGNRQEMIRDPLHRVTGLLDALGQRMQMEYDPRDRITARIDALGNTERYEYDKDSNLTGYTDAEGSRTVYTYDSYARVIAVTDALGNATRNEYDAVGNLTKRTDPNGAETVYSYDETNRLEAVTDPEGNVHRYEYDNNGNLKRFVDPNGGETRIEYDGRNLPLKVTDAAGGVSLMSYDAAGRLRQETDPLGHAVLYTYDALGRLTEQTDALGQKTVYTYDSSGRLIQTVNPNGGVWQLDYDPRGMLVKITGPLGQASEMTRDALGRVIDSIDEAGKTTSYRYDAAGQVTALINPLGHMTEMAYDARGLLTALKDAKGQTTQYGYDPLGRLHKVTNALGAATAYGHDAMGNITSKTDALGRITSYEYNLNSQLIREIGPEQRVTELIYDRLGNRTGVKLSDGETTSYGYDLMSRLTDILYPDGKQVGYEYDAAGRRTRMTDELGETSYTYDALNRLTKVTDPYEQTIQYEWTPSGQRSKIVYPDAAVVHYQYDLLDRMTAVTDAAGRVTSYAYDVRGMLISKSLPTMGQSSYRYDDAGQLLELTHQNQFGKIMEQMTYAYDPVGNRIRSERLSDGDDEDGGDSQELIVTDYAYDALNQLIDVQTQNAVSVELPVSTQYLYDAVGNRLSKTSVWGEVTDTESYTYDAADRLLQWTNSSEMKDYIYDPQGNLLQVMQKDLLSETETEPQWSEPEVIEQYTWNGASRLIEQINRSGDVTRYAYDGDGNRMKMIVDLAYIPEDGRGTGDGNGGSDCLEVPPGFVPPGLADKCGNADGGSEPGNGNDDGSGAPDCFTVPPGFVPPGLADKCGGETTYPDDHPGGTRDGWEKQFKKKHWEFHYTNDVSLALPEPIQVTEADPTKWKETYVYGAGGERIGMTYLPAYDHDNGWEPSPGAGGAEPGVSPKTLYYMADGLGSALGVMTEDGRMSARYHYDEFGIPLPAKKFDPNWPGPDNLFGYTGLGYDYTSGLTYARARYYQPELGRFISEDTYEGDMWNPQSQNRYAYVHNNPLKYVDPTGHKVWLIHGTFSNPETWTPEFKEYIGDLYNEDVATHYWSGGNNKSARKEGAEALAEEIIKWRQENPDEPIRLVGHSHGGNVAIMVANLLGEENVKVETLVTVATPVRGYQLKQEVGQHLHVYNERDGVQVNGGSIWLLGKARRTFSGAANVKVEVDEKYDGIESHSVMHSNVDVWKKYIQGLLADFYVKPE
ncbi:DUF6531 domain-containing protein [Paenibacillus alkaliterrae]|uniref:DUF6531 domain-containing protein n=1 Tax=Paenibacillus alkaliterrae TaxID=320909 RepID=UPI001F355693|nr:DUF6531 domain-containing protein [Paenibacillus alkaliterrae]MCF2939542.1 DUF6531 domain-containing protein [Paenibacillus alkaliterrae]